MLSFLRRPAPAAPAAAVPPPPSTAPGADPAQSIRDVFVARQPIFDGGDRLFAYELLYRGAANQTAAGGAS